MASAKIKKGDKVIVLTGRDKGKQGEVIAVMPSEGRALVRGVNMVRRHTKQSAQNPEGGILSKEGPINLSKSRDRGSEGRQADPRRLPRPGGRHQDPLRKALGREHPG